MAGKRNTFKLGLAALLMAGFMAINPLNAQENSNQTDTNTHNKKCMHFSSEDYINYKFSEQDLKKYNTWIDSAFARSIRKNTKAMIVDKSAYTLYLIDSGQVVFSYPIELGGNPYDDKTRVKDGCTPEGEFYVDKAPSTFYKSFHIAYPSARVTEKGFESKLINKTKYDQIMEAIKDERMPDQYTKLGGLLKIHGWGSGVAGNNGGNNWTDGCIALKNKHIDQLYSHLKQRSKLTIVKYTNRSF